MLSFLRNEAQQRKSRRLIWLFGGPLLLALILGASCSNPPPEVSPPIKKPVAADSAQPDVPPEDLLYEQLRSGSFQLNAAAGSIEEALGAARKAQKQLAKWPQAKEGMEDVVEFVNSAGEGVSEFGDDPPSKDEVAKNFASFDDKRLKAIEAASDALHDLREALGILESLTGSESTKVVEIALIVKALLAVAIDDVWGAVEALGGEPEASNEPLNP